MSRKRILLVDDDPDQRLAIRLPLGSAGYAIIEGRQYTGRARTAVTEVKPDLIVLDVMMDTATAGFPVRSGPAQPRSAIELKEFRKHRSSC